MELLGHVGKVSKFFIGGWAISVDDPTYLPIINLIQEGNIVISLKPNFRMPGLREKLNLSPATSPEMYQWRIWLPLANGIKPNIPFDICFGDNGDFLRKGNEIKIDLFEDIEESALDDLRSMSFYKPRFKFIDGKILLDVEVEFPGGVDVEPKIIIEDCLELEPKRLLPTWLEKKNYKYELNISDCINNLSGMSHLKIYHEPSFGAYNKVYTSIVPGSLFQKDKSLYPIPDIHNITRVAGPKGTQESYLIGGATTFYQINSILDVVLGTHLSSFETIVDWGVGCGRVIRHFEESVGYLGIAKNYNWNLIGLDIDPVNIQWCKDNLPDIGRFDVLSFDGFDLEDDSVDLLYGISVFTHLTEYEQHRWLSEINRIMKPGGMVIVTVHGEGSFYKSPTSICLPFVEKFDFFDGVADSAIGSDLDTYYRAAYHSRRYLNKYWTEYFEFSAIIPLANSFNQDFIVLKKR